MDIKVLLILTGHQGHDGISTTWLTYLSAIKRNKVLAESVTFSTLAMTGLYEKTVIDKFRELGCVIHYVPNRKTDTWAYYNELRKVLKNGKYDIVHVNGSSALMAIEMYAAYKEGVRIRIAHSRNTTCSNKILHHILYPVFDKYCTDRFACGSEAGKYLFRNKPFTIINNGKDLSLFTFSQEKRDCIRKQLKLSDKYVIGHVGLFNKQKNHQYLIKVFAEFKKQCNESLLFLIGDGVMMDDIKVQVEQLGLSENVIFAGHVNNVYDYLQAMDMMVFPSLFEGLPNVVIEWQAMGLPCIISDKITRQCAVTPLVDSQSIESNPSVWASRIMDIKNNNSNRANDSNLAHKLLSDTGFDIDENAKFLVAKYEDILNKRVK